MKKKRNISKVIAVSLLISLSLCSGTAAPPAAAAPGESSATADTSVENDRLYDEIWNLIDAHFLYRERLNNWVTWRHKFDGQMKTKHGTNAAINAMLDSLSDEYTFFRDEEVTEEKKVQRQKTKVVDHKMLDGQVGYIHITTFNSVFCVPETARALIELNRAHGIVLDLRDNSGGSINSAFDVFSLLTNSGKFVSMRGTTDFKDYFEEMTLTNDWAISADEGVILKKERISNLAGQKPLVVLVDKNTKSAAEMLAGALRDNGRATVVGCKTYGKGIVQRVWEFPNNTSIKISSARYFLPGGTYIHRVGIVPDFYVDTAAIPKIKNRKRNWTKRQPTDLRLASINIDSKTQTEKISHNGQLSADSESAPVANRDRMLNEARMLLKRKLVSLAKP